jgi:hypothetical protein
MNEVRVCENPSVIEAAADKLGPGCPPLVCTFGWPTTAAFSLLAGLENAGVTLQLRADDDRAGQAIVTRLQATLPSARLWRYDVRPPADAATTPVYEEQLLDTLVADLAASANGAQAVS